MTAPHLLPKVRSEGIMRAAQGQPCAIRVSSLYPMHRCSGVETVVACHLPVDGKGVASKVTDTAVAFGCSNCHAILDGADASRRAYIIDHAPAAFMERLLRGYAETVTRLVIAGVIVVPDADLLTIGVQSSCHTCRGGDAPPQIIKDGWWKCPTCRREYEEMGDE